MKQFTLLFRMNNTNSHPKPSEEQMILYMEQWTEWIHSIESKDQLKGGNHFATAGVVLKPGNVVENTPFASHGVSVAGYILIQASDVNEAISIARQCPILKGENTSVEIRELAAPGKDM